ncbi:sulfite exporter TauE/SafE family protein [Massilia glaciei]|uniref:Probable membrane transporter protein n=1 Tax=Massilia glaciei TaxID=1524097 RepID=A0A2U2HNP0_9BURK|nr:sulfite exporter TauE/SafE family protein [Massilia glaciei]PWF49120.1 sulfite exporter TauE/SafE family protein [Massilia glaciei]
MKLYRKLGRISAQPGAQLAAQDPNPPLPLAIRLAMGFTSLVMLTLVIFVLARFLQGNDSGTVLSLVKQTLSDRMFWAAVAVGFFAQAVDGALGMAYGITSTTFLLSVGATPAMASASVHIAEIFTTGVSGVAHAKLGNVDKRLFLRLLVPGMIGAILGAVLVTQIDGKALKPFISAYLLIMGLYILSKAWRKISPRKDQPRHVGKLALFGGFVDSAGGGGWGPVVTTSLVGSGCDPRTTIGSVNFAEFYLALAGATAFALMIGTGVWVLVLGLVIGGLFAAPFAALVTKRLATRALLLLVGTLISIVSCFNLYKSLLA